MAQETPSNILYAQAIQAIKKLSVSYSTSQLRSPQDISESINDALSKFVDNVGKPSMRFTPLKKSEPPRSQKINEFMANLQLDINIGQDQVDLLNASAVLTHNNIKTDILQAQKDNARLQNKIKTLELYSNADDSSLLYFGDTFITEDFIDWSLVSDAERATHLSSGYLALHLTQQSNAIKDGTTVKILDSSNGFCGNNQEIKDASTTLTDPTTGQKLYTFVADSYKAADVLMVLDQKPTTWFEFEKYQISPALQNLAGNYNFEYVLNADNRLTAHLKPSADVNKSQTGSVVKWADGPDGGVLKFYIEIDLISTQNVNLISLLPYGLTNNINNPIHIIKVSTSVNGTDWTILGPQNVWISNSIDKKISSINAETILIGDASWVSDGTAIRYIRFEIEQPQPIACDIGHVYYIPKETVTHTPNYNIEIPQQSALGYLYDTQLPYDTPSLYGGNLPIYETANDGYGNTDKNGAGQTNEESFRYVPKIQDELDRLEGPLPPAENPQYYLKAKNSVVNDMTQKVELMRGRRWAIGIRDIAIQSNVYAATGVIVSKKFNVPGIVDRVALEADILIPDSYDKTIDWVKFYVSADDGSTWYRISRIQDDFNSIPEIIAFNDPTPTALRESGVGYYDVKGTVNSLRFKAEINRPDSEQNSTPVLKSYKLKIVKRS